MRECEDCGVDLTHDPPSQRRWGKVWYCPGCYRRRVKREQGWDVEATVRAKLARSPRALAMMKPLGSGARPDRVEVDTGPAHMDHDHPDYMEAEAYRRASAEAIKREIGEEWVG